MYSSGPFGSDFVIFQAGSGASEEFSASRLVSEDTAALGRFYKYRDGHRTPDTGHLRLVVLIGYNSKLWALSRVALQQGMTERSLWFSGLRLFCDWTSRSIPGVHQACCSTCPARSVPGHKTAEACG